MEQIFDVAIIGGGINGCGSAADAAIRGLSVILIEKNDIASKTSSASSKLIHGGLRYLEYYDFTLVKKALNERQLLLQLAPYLVHPVPFVLPYQQHLRPSWLLRTGLFVYDKLSRKNTLPHSKLIRRASYPNYFLPLQEQFQKGFLFYDCTTDDSRLTLVNALQAKKHGAKICTGLEVECANYVDGLWYLQTQNNNKQKHIIKAKSIINASGPWAEKLNKQLNIPNKFSLSLVKGSHIVVHKLYEGNHAYLLQHRDKRVIFIIPYKGYTMIGTTDVTFSNSLDEISISAEETNYLLKLVNSYLDCQLDKKDIITTWSGVRPLLASTTRELKAISRDYCASFTETPGPAVTIYGGKITTYRHSALEAVDQLKSIFPELASSKTDKIPLPGSTLDGWSYSKYEQHAFEKYFWLDNSLIERYLSQYGTRTEQLLSDCSQISDLGKNFGCGLYEKEVAFLVQEEWAKSVDDILWRRTKLGLNFTPTAKQALVNYLKTNKN